MSEQSQIAAGGYRGKAASKQGVKPGRKNRLGSKGAKRTSASRMKGK